MPTKAHHFLMALRRHQKNLSRPTAALPAQP
jgi:hypothetical protein